jgi:hypothetical protein
VLEDHLQVSHVNILHTEHQRLPSSAELQNFFTITGSHHPGAPHAGVLAMAMACHGYLATKLQQSKLTSALRHIIAMITAK